MAISPLKGRLFYFYSCPHYRCLPRLIIGLTKCVIYTSSVSLRSRSPIRDKSWAAKQDTKQMSTMHK